MITIGIILASFFFVNGVQGQQVDLSNQQDEQRVGSEGIQPIRVLIGSNPPGRIFVETKGYETSPVSYDLMPGSYEVQIERDGYTTINDVIHVREGGETWFFYDLKLPFLQYLRNKYMEYFFIALVFVAFAVSSFLFRKNKKIDIETQKKDFKKPEPPQNITPAEAGFLYYRSFHIRQVLASVIYLATKGYLVIREVGETERDQLQGARYTMIWRKNLSHDDKSISMFDAFVFTHIFSKGYEVDIRKLVDMSAREREQLQEEMVESLVKRKYYVKNPSSFKKDSCLAGFLAGIIISIILVDLSPLFALIAFIVVGVSALVSSFRKDHIEYWGYNALEMIKTADQFIVLLEKKGLQGLYNPEDFNDLFEKFLPYAIILENEKQWCVPFEGLLTEPFDWYESEHSFSPSAFAEEVKRLASNTRI